MRYVQRGIGIWSSRVAESYAKQQCSRGSNSLVLISDSFPFGTGEEFLEDEIVYLAEQFHSIVIVAVRADDTMLQSRSIPSNVRAFAGRSSRSTKVTWESGDQFIKGAVKLCRVFPSIVNGWRRIGDGVRSPLAFLQSVRFEASAQLVFRRIVRAVTLPPSDLSGCVVVYSYWFHLTARVGELLLERIRICNPGVSTVFLTRAHGYDLYHHRSRSGCLPQRRHLLAAVDSISCVSEHGRRYLAGLYPEYVSKFFVDRLGTRSPQPKADISRKSLRITSCSGIVAVKRLTLIPAVLQRLVDEGLDPVWTHIGDGPDRLVLEDLIRAYGLQERVTLIGHVPHDELFYRLASIPTTLFINLSSSEGAPVSLMEAMSQGIPVVATDVGGTGEIVFDKQTGRLVSADARTEDVVSAIRWIWELEQTKFEQMQSACRRLWSERYFGERNYSAFALSLAERCPEPGV